jgi:hypothetical protein
MILRRRARRAGDEAEVARLGRMLDGVSPGATDRMAMRMLEWAARPSEPQKPWGGEVWNGIHYPRGGEAVGSHPYVTSPEGCCANCAAATVTILTTPPGFS